MLDHFSRPYPDSFNRLVLAHAPAHLAQALRVPDNLVLIGLPPYCPELNPLERLWQDLKRRLTTRAATPPLSLTALPEAAAQFIGAYTPAQLASFTGYPYLLNIAMHSAFR